MNEPHARAFTVRRLEPSDLAPYRELHRFGLTQSPEAFVETPENDAARPDADVEAMLRRGEGWGLFDGERLVGKMVLDAVPYDCLSDTRWVHALYLHPEARGCGGADTLLTTAIDNARAEGVVVIALWLNAENTAARRLYERLGFREAGRVPRGIRVGGRYVDDVLMVRQA